MRKGFVSLSLVLGSLLVVPTFSAGLSIPDAPGLLFGATPVPVPGSLDPAVQVERVYQGLAFPVAIKFDEKGRIWYGEWLTGWVKIIETDGTIKPFVKMNVVTGGEQGLTEIDLHTTKDGKKYLYAYYSYGPGVGWGQAGDFNRLVRFEIKDGDVAGPQEILLDRILAGVAHNTGIMTWGPDDGYLYLNTGDAVYYWPSQSTDNLNGGTLRLNEDGTPAPGNTWNSYKWNRGLRNAFGMDWHPITHALFSTENGESTNDEVNILKAGKNYGWPVVTGKSSNKDFENPIIVHARTIGPTNCKFYTGLRLPPNYWNALLYGDTNNGFMYRVTLAPPTFETVAENRVVVDLNEIIVDLEMGPSGYLYFSGSSGKIYRLAPVRNVVPDMGTTYL